MNKLKTFYLTLYSETVIWMLYIEIGLLIGLALIILIPTAALKGTSTIGEVWGVVAEIASGLPNLKEMLKQSKEAFEEALCKSKK